MESAERRALMLKADSLSKYIREMEEKAKDWNIDISNDKLYQAALIYRAALVDVLGKRIV